MPTALGEALEFVLDNSVKMIEIVTANPVLCLGVAAWCAGLAIGLYRRLV